MNVGDKPGSSQRILQIYEGIRPGRSGVGAGSVGIDIQDGWVLGLGLLLSCGNLGGDESGSAYRNCCRTIDAVGVLSGSEYYGLWKRIVGRIKDS